MRQQVKCGSISEQRGTAESKVSAHRKYMLRIYSCFVVSLMASCVMIYVSVTSAMEVPLPSPQEIASWPPSVMLGAVCIMCCVIAYKTWARSWEIMHEMTSELRQLRELLASRPCVIDNEEK